MARFGTLPLLKSKVYSLRTEFALKLLAYLRLLRRWWKCETKISHIFRWRWRRSRSTEATFTVDSTCFCKITCLNDDIYNLYCSTTSNTLGNYQMQVFNRYPHCRAHLWVVITAWTSSKNMNYNNDTCRRKYVNLSITRWVGVVMLIS